MNKMEAIIVAFLFFLLGLISVFGIKNSFFPWVHKIEIINENNEAVEGIFIVKRGKFSIGYPFYVRGKSSSYLANGKPDNKKWFFDKELKGAIKIVYHYSGNSDIDEIEEMGTSLLELKERGYMVKLNEQ